VFGGIDQSPFSERAAVDQWALNGRGHMTETGKSGNML